ncbi:MAG: hypothetical protein ACMUEL_07890 [Flavobacteriales bacterium Tduv]
MGSRTYFLQYKALLWIRKISLQRISLRACLAFYGGAIVHNLYRIPEIIMCC